MLLADGQTQHGRRTDRVGNGVHRDRCREPRSPWQRSAPSRCCQTEPAEPVSSFRRKAGICGELRPSLS
jgi:hypothetical protein